MVITYLVTFRRMAILYDLSARSHCHAQVHVYPDHEIYAAGRNDFRIHSICDRYLQMAKSRLFPVTYQSLGNDDRGIAYLYPLALQENKKRLLEGTGLALILGSYFFISAEDLWPGYLAVFPVTGTFLMIQAHRHDSVLTNNIVFQKLGTWSYSIYLWHWPLVVLIYIYSLPEYYVYAGIALSIGLGFLSYKYIEQIKLPSYHQWKDIYRIKPLYFSLVLMSLGVTLNIFNGFNTDLRQGAASEQAKFLDYYNEKFKNLRDAYWLKCDTYVSLTEHNSYDPDPICITKQKEGGVFLWGDSHAEALSLGLRTLLKSNDIPFIRKPPPFAGHR